MNTGIQRSSATPLGAWATTAEVGQGAAGQDSSAARTSPRSSPRTTSRTSRRRSISHWKDLTDKAEKAFAVEGPAFINVFAPCPRGWRIAARQDRSRSRSSRVQTGFWPLFEVEDGVLAPDRQGPRTRSRSRSSSSPRAGSSTCSSPRTRSCSRRSRPRSTATSSMSWQGVPARRRSSCHLSRRRGRESEPASLAVGPGRITAPGPTCRAVRGPRRWRVLALGRRRTRSRSHTRACRSAMMHWTGPEPAA